MNDNKLDVLIKIGVGLIFLSVLIFATNTWNDLSSIFKTGLLFTLGIIFEGLSIFTDKCLKINKSSYMYFIISIIIFVFLFIAIGTFKTFGDWYSIWGKGNLLYFSNFLLYIAILLLICNKKKSSNIFKISSYYITVLSLIFLGEFLNIPSCIMLLLIGIIVNILYQFLKDKLKSYKINVKITNILLFAFTSISLLDLYTDTNNIIECICCIGFFIIFLINKYLNKPNNIIENVMLPISFIISLITILNALTIDFNIAVYILGFGTLLYLLLEIFFDKNNIISKYMLLSFHNLLIIVAIIEFITNQQDYFVIYYLLLICSILPNCYFYKKEIESKILFILKIIGISISILVQLNNFNYSLLFILLFLAIFSFIERKNTFGYHIAFNAALIFTVTLLFTFNTKYLLYGFMPLLIIFNNIMTKKFFPKLKVFVWITSIIMSIFLFLIYNSYLGQLKIISSFYTLLIGAIITVISIILLLVYYKDRKNFQKLTTSFVILIPIIACCSKYLNLGETKCLIFVYFIINALYYDLISKEKFIHYIFYILGPLVLFKSGKIEYYTLLLWTTSIAYILLAYNNIRYKAIGIFGISILGASLLINLIDFWTSVPFYIYLFLLGIVIIAFVTSKEIKKNKEEKNKKEE